MGSQLKNLAPDQYKHSWFTLGLRNDVDLCNVDNLKSEMVGYIN